ncbi:hypothetical protein FQZ97_792150 [compost metagenome]
MLWATYSVPPSSPKQTALPVPGGSPPASVTRLQSLVRSTVRYGAVACANANKAPSGLKAMPFGWPAGPKVGLPNFPQVDGLYMEK